LVTNINQIRNHAVHASPNYTSYNAYPVYTDTSTIAMRKGFDDGQIIGVFSNLGEGGASYMLNLCSGETGFGSEQEIVEVVECAGYTADDSGNVSLQMNAGLPRVLVPRDLVVGSGICGN
jgi:alpha-amylase